MRIKLGITQKKLGLMAGVSTSMINQIESGRSQPSYETAKKIFDNLATLEGKSSSHTAGDFCSKEVVKLKPTNSLNDAIKKMQSHSISQIPIFERNDPVGVVTEDGIVKYLSDHDEKQLKQIPISQIMDALPPVVDYETPAKTLVPLIRFSKCVLVSRNSKVIGIITASDTLKIME